MKRFFIIILAFAATTFAWQQAANEYTGGYWMYDNVDNPPFDNPDLSSKPMPNFLDLQDELQALKLEPYNDFPFRLELPDSFFFYGEWFGPGCPNHWLYISPDGWVGFDQTAQDGAPNPPVVVPPFPFENDPNSIIAPLWQDNNPTLTAEPSKVNRVYYLYDQTTGRLTIQWYDIKSHSTYEKYDYELMLDLGGMELLSGNFSYHFIHFLYNDCSVHWNNDNGMTGFEDQQGEKGIYYGGTIKDGRVVRAGCFLEVECQCDGWNQEPIEIKWRYISPKVECGSSEPSEPTLEIEVIYYDHFQCSPFYYEPLYRWKITGPNGAPGFPKEGGPQGEPGGFSFIPTRRGIYEVTITPSCGNKECEPCTFRVRVRRLNP